MPRKRNERHIVLGFPAEFAFVELARVNCREKTSSGGEIGTENHSGLRQLREGGRRGARRHAPGDLRRRPPRLESRRPLRRLRGEDAGPRGRTARSPAEGRRSRLERRFRRERPKDPSCGRSTMGRWDSTSSRGLQMRAKSRSCWSAIWHAWRTSRHLIVPNASDVDRVERDLLARCGCLFSGSIGTFDDLFRRLIRSDPEQRPVATDAQRALVVRRTLAAAPLNGLARSARTGGFADTLLQTLGELEQGMLEPGRPRRRSRPALRRATGPSSTGSASGTATSCAAGRPSGSSPTSTRGTASPSSPTASRISPGPSGRCSRRSQAAPRCTSRCPTSRAASHSPRSQRTADDLVVARRRAHRGAAAAVGGVRASGARSPRAGPLRGVAAAAARARCGCPILRGRGRARNARARRRGADRAHPQRRAARTDRTRRSFARAVAGTARDGARRARDAVRDRVARAPRRDAARARASAAAPLRLARRRPPRALRVPALAVLRPRALIGRLRRRQAARTRDPHACARRGGGREAARGAACRRSPSCAEPRHRPRACAG